MFEREREGRRRREAVAIGKLADILLALPARSLERLLSNFKVSALSFTFLMLRRSNLFTVHLHMHLSHTLFKDECVARRAASVAATALHQVSG